MPCQTTFAKPISGVECIPLRYSPSSRRKAPSVKSFVPEITPNASPGSLYDFPQLSDQRRSKAAAEHKMPRLQRPEILDSIAGGSNIPCAKTPKPSRPSLLTHRTQIGDLIVYGLRTVCATFLN